MVEAYLRKELSEGADQTIRSAPFTERSTGARHPWPRRALCCREEQLCREKLSKSSSRCVRLRAPSGIDCCDSSRSSPRAKGCMPISTASGADRASRPETERPSSAAPRDRPPAYHALEPPVSVMAFSSPPASRIERCIDAVGDAAGRGEQVVRRRGLASLRSAVVSASSSRGDVLDDLSPWRTAS